MLRSAFIEFYRGLGLLRTYSSLNMVAFAKILKKYDKVTGWNASAAYLKVVEQSYFNSSDKVLKLMDDIEALFIQHFPHKNRKYGMSCLRPAQQKASHTITFLLGLLSGCSLALFAAFFIVVHLSGEYASASTLASESSAYMKSIFPTFRHGCSQNEWYMSKCSDMIHLSMQYVGLDTSSHVRVWLECLSLEASVNYLCIHFLICTWN